MSDLPEAVPQSPACGACGDETWHDGDQFRCDDCLLCFDHDTMEAEFLDPETPPCGAPCTNQFHGPGKLKPGLTFECVPCALPTGHHDGKARDFQHWHDCKAVPIDTSTGLTQRPQAAAMSSRAEDAEPWECEGCYAENAAAESACYECGRDRE